MHTDPVMSDTARQEQIREATDSAHNAQALLNGTELDLSPSQLKALADLYRASSVLAHGAGDYASAWHDLRQELVEMSRDEAPEYQERRRAAQLVLLVMAGIALEHEI